MLDQTTVYSNIRYSTLSVNVAFSTIHDKTTVVTK